MGTMWTIGVALDCNAEELSPEIKTLLDRTLGDDETDSKHVQEIRRVANVDLIYHSNRPPDPSLIITLKNTYPIEDIKILPGSD
ncbi:MAG: hypothetical protein HY366_01450 [Candidatus Aenigmarchaeota archaeon]|nr:hypothetical protein [Candidatus Aenigmarchaeota archaeon]